MTTIQSPLKLSCAATMMLLVFQLLASIQFVSASSDIVRADYGLDISYPMHYRQLRDSPLGDRESFYQEFVRGCEKHYGKKGFRCAEYESDRIAMTLRQPQSMQNYTDLGFKKIKTPERVWKLIKAFWDKNKQHQKQENWPQGNTYVNHWVAPSRMVSVEDSSLRGGGYSLKQEIWDSAKETISEWTDQELTQCSLYGVRVYTEGAVLSSHVDRLPLVSSAIINVDADVDEPWPLEVIGHDGRAYNVTMEPGDMVLYESHSIIHGRPFPLKGRFVANLFVHFEPTGHSLRHHIKNEHGKDVHKKYKDSVQRGHGGHEHLNNDGLPPYLIPGSPEVANYIARNPNSEAARRARANTSTTGSTVAHMLASKGDLAQMQAEVEKSKNVIHARDSNGWRPLHEAVRSGNVDIVRYLFEQGADVNARTGTTGKGMSPLKLAERTHGADHPVSLFLASVGGESIEPEL